MPEDHVWWAIIPMKDTRLAKCRMGGTPGRRRQLAIVMARDTICAIANAGHVSGTVVVCQREEDVESFALPGVRVLVQPGLDMNQAVLAGERSVRKESPDAWLFAAPGDLPYLRATELDAALERASRVDRACVADRAGTGTTLLTARGATPLSPAFGPGSLRRHEHSGAVRLDVPGWSGLRRDVDEPDDVTTRFGLGARTARTLAAHSQETLVPETVMSNGAR